MTASGVLALIELLSALEKQAEAAARAIREKRDEDWFGDSAELRDKWAKAKTPEELKNVSASLADLISRL